MHEKLKTLPRKVEFGISPFGIYRTNKKYFTEESESHGKKDQIIIIVVITVILVFLLMFIFG